MRRRVSLTPLIDVVFILLLFFMLASTFNDWTSLRLDSGPGIRAAGRDGALLINVEGVTHLALEGEPVTLADLERRLIRRLKAFPDKPVAVQPGKGAKLQRVVGVMDVACRAGARNVTLVGD